MKCKAQVLTDPRREIIYRSLLALSTLFLATLILSTFADAQTRPGRMPRIAQSVPGQYIVKFRPQMTAARRSSERSKLGVSFVRSLDLIEAQVVQATAGGTIDDAYAKKLLADGKVDYIEPNYIVHTMATPNDSRFGELWGMHNTGQSSGTADVDIDAPEAWNLSTGSNEVVVGIVDTGVNYAHPDLAANMWRNPGEIAGNSIDDDGNGVIDDVYGYNAITASGDPMDDHSHGSHCAGTIAGVGNNSTGVAGVNWRAKIMGLKFLNSSGSGSTDDAVRAIQYAVTMKSRGVNIRVLSNSWGGGGPSQSLTDAVKAANTAGILFVAAAGNAGSDNDSTPSYPANIDAPNVVSVAAVDRNGNLASFSNYGLTSVDVAAPGVDIVSTVLGSNYASYSGTSMATPHVSGVAALILAREPTLSIANLRSRLLTTAKPLATLTGLIVAPGIVDAYNALTNTLTPLPPPGTLPRYSKSAATFNYDTTLGSRILNVDDGFADIALPFSFSYFKTNYSRVAVSANGRIVPLGASDAIPAATDYSNRLAQGIHVYNDDLYPAGTDGGVWYKSDAESATFTWVVYSYAHRNAPTADSLLKFQAKIFKSGKIEFHYLDTDTGDTLFSFGASATIGLAAGQGIAGEPLTVSSNVANPLEIGSGKALSFEPTARVTRSDFDGDGISDLVVFRPTTGFWYILTSSTGFDFASQLLYQHGLYGDIPLVGDFDGDGRSDMAVWRPSTATWYFRNSTTNFAIQTAIQWGLPGDVPMVGDFDGDFQSDLTVYRTSNGSFYSLLSHSGYNRASALTGNSAALLSVKLGGKGHDPIIGDFTGANHDSFGTIYQQIRYWSVKNTSNQLLFSLPWGMPGDTPLACDYDHNGVSDRIAVRVSSALTLNWFVITDSGLVYTENFGSLNDSPNCLGDYDGDHRSDLSVFRNHTGEWFIRDSSSSETRSIQFGLPGDIPL